MIANRQIPLRDSEFIRQAWQNGRECALVDVREEAQFAQGHPLFAVNIPISGLMAAAALRLPRRTTPVTLYDGGEQLAYIAARRLLCAGYSDVALLQGGLDGWAQAGGELFIDVNSPSKAFGELVETVRHTPSVSAEEVMAMQRDQADMVILDARRFDEYQTMSIPGGVSVPGGELVLRARSLAPSASTRVIVNCAGRTRSIIGAQSLINAGLPNPVMALRNGAIGWALAGGEFERGQTRRYGGLSAEDRDAAAQDAQRVADRAGVRRIRAGQLALWLRQMDRTTYLFDVRSPDEYAAGHWPGAISAPGGQLIQETDHFAAVRGARIVLADDNGLARANMAASWLIQMGWEVGVLAEQPNAEFSQRGAPPLPMKSAHRYRRPYEGTDHSRQTLQDYLNWEAGLVAQLENERVHGFNVL